MGVAALGALLFLGSLPVARAELSLVNRWPGGGEVCVDTLLRLTFNHPPVLESAGKIEIVHAADGQLVETIALDGPGEPDPVGRRRPVQTEGATVTIRLRSHALGFGEAYEVRIGRGVFRDFDGLENEWKFKTKEAPGRGSARLEVAADGSGHFYTVQRAIDQVDAHRTEPVTIFVRKGRYQELVRVSRERRHVHLVGEDRKGTVIAEMNNDRLNPGWIQRAVVGVEGDDFVLENLTVQNTTPYKGSQAEAVYVNAQRCVLRNADLLSFQDTLHLSGRVYVTNCYIEGDVDFVWGYGTAYIERSELRMMHTGYIVQARNAAGRGGYIFRDCRFTAAPGVKDCWLARVEADRFPESQVTFIRCAMGAHLRPAGWQVTGAPQQGLRFEEFASTDLEGKPLEIRERVSIGQQLTIEQAERQTVGRVLGDLDGWKPQ